MKCYHLMQHRHVYLRDYKAKAPDTLKRLNGNFPIGIFLITSFVEELITITIPFSEGSWRVT